MTTKEWIRKSIQTIGYVQTCKSYTEYCLAETVDDRGGTSKYSSESFSRDCRRQRLKMERKERPSQPFDVETALQSTDFHKVDLGKFDITGVRVNTWGAENNQNKQVRLDLKAKKDAIDWTQIVEDFKKEIEGHTPLFPNTPARVANGQMLEIAIPDLHFGLLSWDKETGHDYDIKLARRTYLQCVDAMLEWGSRHPIERIMLVLGSDFFNSDNSENTTTKGTRQDEDTRAQKTFTEGWKTARDAIDKCLAIAPVDVVIIRGNHDTQRAYFLGEVIGAWYESNRNVSVDNQPTDYKAYIYGKNFIGLAHGHLCKHDKLPGVFANDFPVQWGNALNRVAHVGHTHSATTIEFPGMLVEVIPSLGAPSAWTTSMGYRGARQANAYLWDKYLGNQFVYKYRPEVLV